jgi:crotonobetainyl-CoA:carnitine CoA-transferase CaiB-like acyl-CoA transferase
MTTQGPLHGFRVLELGNMYAAPTAGRMLRDFGAEVIKVEEPTAGDTARQWVPQQDGLSLGFARLNSGKRSVGIDLRTSAGRDLVLALVEQCDVVIESFRPGRMEQWGLSHAELSTRNAGVVLARVSGFGQTGPYRERPGFGTVAEAVSGYAFMNGWPHTPPTSPPFGFADSIAGISTAFGIAMALLRRERTGRGAEVDIALYEPLMFILGDAILRFTSNGEIMQRQGNTTGAASPRGTYQAQDERWVCIAASSQSIALRLFDAIGRPELKSDERFATGRARLANNDQLQEIVTAFVASRPRDEVLAIFEKFEVVAAPINDASDVVADPHFRERTLMPLLRSALGDVVMPGPVVHLDGYPGPEYVGVPGLGEHTEDVLRGMLGLDAGTIADLRTGGVVGGRAG